MFSNLDESDLSSAPRSSGRLRSRRWARRERCCGLGRGRSGSPRPRRRSEPWSGRRVASGASGPVGGIKFNN